jgi:hypothetical protein
VNIDSLVGINRNVGFTKDDPLRNLEFFEGMNGLTYIFHKIFEEFLRLWIVLW